MMRIVAILGLFRSGNLTEVAVRVRSVRMRDPVCQAGPLRKQ